MQLNRQRYRTQAVLVLLFTLKRRCVCYLNFSTDLTEYYGYLQFHQTYTAVQIETLLNKWHGEDKLRVLVSGDSLTRQQASWIANTLDSMKLEEPQNLETLTLYHKTSGVYMDDRVFLQHYSAPCGFSNVSGYLNYDMELFLKRISDLKPNVVVFNLGLHLMHLMPARKFLCLGQYLYMEEGMDNFLHYLKDKLNPAPIFIFVTSNSMCEDRMIGWYEEVHAQWDAGDPTVLETCVSHAREILDQQIADNIIKHDHVPDEELAEACKLTYFSDDGVRHINFRMVKALNQAEEWYPAPIRVLNGYDVTYNQCWATEDGRHYPPLAVVQANTLLHALTELV